MNDRERAQQMRAEFLRRHEALREKMEATYQTDFFEAGEQAGEDVVRGFLKFYEGNPAATLNAQSFLVGLTGKINMIALNHIDSHESN